MGKRSGMIVMVYHRVSGNLPCDYLAVNVHNFRRQMGFLYKNNYTIIGIEEMLDIMINPNRCLLSAVRYALITFDDGFKDNYTNAYPVLKEFGFKAAIFLSAGKIGRDEAYLSWNEAVEMAQNGITFGSHTLTHPDLRGLSAEEIKRELYESRYIIEQKLRRHVDFFCYPKGYFDERVKQAVKEAGYKAAFSVIPGRFRQGDDIYEIKRIGIGNKDNLLRFRLKLCKGYEGYYKMIGRIPSYPPLKKGGRGDFQVKLNILYIIWSLGLGGAERVVINLAKGLDKNRFKPIVCCLNDKGIFAEELEREGIKVIALNKKQGLDFGVIAKIIEVIKENKIDIVHTHLWGANFWGRIAARLAKTPAIFTTEHNEDIWKSGAHFFFDKYLSGWTDKIIAVSNSVKEFYVSKGILSEKIEVIYNGVKINKPSAVSYQSLVKEKFDIKEDETVLAVIGRLVPQKGHKYLFEALSSLNDGYKLKLLVVGDGPEKERLLETQERLGLEGKIIFTGLRTDVPRLFGVIDILVMPSLREGFPIVALEAMAQGVPVVATDVGGNKELVINNETGLLVPVEDSNGLAEALVRLFRDKDKRKQMGFLAKGRVEKYFSLEKMLEQTQRLYENSIK